jgi:serine/threonine protein kinase
MHTMTSGTSALEYRSQSVDTLTRFIPIHRLGHGSFATVRQAVSRQTGQMYAVKIVHRSKFRTSGPMSKEMFMREVSILERLEHKNICTLKETFQDEQSICECVCF